MSYTILTLRETQESDLCGQFLSWQNKIYVTEITSEGLRLSKGSAQPVIFYDGIIVAIGFLALIKYFTEQGLLLC